MKAKKILTWKDFDRQMTLMYMKYKDKKIKYVVGISRGGLVASTRISNVLKVPMGIVDVSSYKETERKELVFGTISVDTSKRNDHILLVDDIWDSGATMTRVIELLQSMGFTNISWETLVDKRLEHKDKWIVFPWER